MAVIKNPKVTVIKELLTTLRSSEIKEIEDFATEHRLSRPFSFMKLPVELRHMVYEHVVTPDMAKDHVTKNKIPTLFNVNHEISWDFAAVYYSRKVFKVELLKPDQKTWRTVQDWRTVQTMFESIGGSMVERELRISGLQKQWAEEDQATCSHASMNIGLLS